MALPIAEAFVEIRGRTAKYRAKITQAKRQTEGFGKSAGKSLKMVTLGLAALGAAAAVTAAVIAVKLTKSIIRLGSQALQSFAQLQQGMAEVSTMIKGNFGPALTALSTGVRKLSLEVPHATESLSTALYDLLSASVPVSESLKALKTSSRAAVAGLSSVQTAANLGTGTANALNIAYSDMDKIFDTAFATVRMGKITFGELAGSLGQALASAKKMNASIEEVYGSIAFLTKNTLSADTASISFGRALDGLADKADILEDMGVKVFGTEGQYLGILKVVEQIAEQIKGLTDQAKVKIFEEMGFDIRAARAIVIMSENVEQFRDTLDGVTDSAGDMEIAYSRMAGTLVNKWKILKNSVAELGRTIVERLVGAMGTLVDSLTIIIQKLSIVIKRYKDHGLAAATVFREIAKIAVSTTIEMFKAIIELIASAAKIMWVPLKFGFLTAMRDISDSAEKTIIDVVNFFRRGGDEIAKLQKRTVDTNRFTWDMIRKQQEKAEFSLVFAKESKKIQKTATEAFGVLMANIKQSISVLDDFIKTTGGAEDAVAEMGKEMAEVAEPERIKAIKTEFSAWGFVIDNNIKFLKRFGREAKVVAKDTGLAFSLIPQQMDMAKMILELNRSKKAIEEFKEKAKDTADAIKPAFENMFVGLFSGKTKDLWTQFWDDLKQIAIRKLAEVAATKIFEKIINAIAKEKEVATTGGAVKSGVKTGVGAGIGAWIGSLIAPGVGTAIGANIGANIGGSFAEGGIVRKPTLAMIGERGPEAIIPLNRAQPSSMGRPIIFSGNIVFNETDFANMDRTRLEKAVRQQIMPIIQQAAADGIGG